MARCYIRYGIYFFAVKYLHDQIKGRTCGECTACCTSLGVEELSKPLWQRCEHVCEAGCAIYPDRPRSCHDFTCLWLHGFFGLDKHRPDKLGLIFAMQRDRKLGAILVAWESWPGAMSKDPGLYVLNRLSAQRYVYVFPFGEKTHRVIIGPGIEQMKKAAGA